MADVHTAQQRRYNMQQIRSSNTKPELLVRKFLHANGYRYTLHGLTPGLPIFGRDRLSPSGEGKRKRLPGKPDIVLPKYRTIIFVHGCFWHGHNNCKYYKVPQTRTDWWLNKINTNKANDARAVKALKKEGWKVITVWECKLKPKNMEKFLQNLLKGLSNK